VHAGLRYRERPDLALIAADGDAVAAGVFTRNQFPAAPVLLCREHLKLAEARAILVNSGIANACTGDEGYQNAREMARLAAETLGVEEEKVLVASTGVIGLRLPMDAVRKAVPHLVEELRYDGWEEVARAIMTTDTVPKRASAEAQIGDRPVIISGVAKGAGMIAPNMATLLAFVCTDAAISPELLRYWTAEGAERSFNRITIDGDTSTNDTLLALASGRAGNTPLTDITSPESHIFGETFCAVLLDLAKQIVLDGEGATKFIEVRVAGAPTLEAARNMAFTIANSPLVKTAFFGEDANWGRIIAAAGRAGVPLEPRRVTLFFDNVCVFRGGTPVGGPQVEEAATEVFQQKEITILLDAGEGDCQYSVYTCDLSIDYIKINASYRS
jgi:glutamate N-acetyltransferase/amino-acid N-acetyltransferase